MVLRDKIYGRNHLVGSGQMYHPDRIEELDNLREQHERLVRGKPARPFGDLLAEKLKVLRQGEEGEEGRDEPDAEEEAEDEDQKGAIDPHLGLMPKQTALANPNKGRRSGKVILKG